jgi:hypothetical protein
VSIIWYYLFHHHRSIVRMGDNKLLAPLSFWVQISNWFFLLAGLHGDLLIIRLSLFLAYLLLVVNSVVGSPLWPLATAGNGKISVDGLLWAAVSLYVHGASLFALIWDERHVQLNEDEVALWRMMYRTGGLSQRLFQTILSQKLAVVELPAGETIDTDNYFYIVYHGQVRLQVIEGNVSTSTRILVSGEMFDLKLIGLFSTANTVFHSGSIRCTALTNNVRLFQIQKDDMEKVAHHPLAKSVWQALLINNLSYVVESYLSEEKRSSHAELYCDKIFRPLESWEQPQPSLAGSGQAWAVPLFHLVGSIRRSFSPPWPFIGHPTGIRQTQLPPPPQRPAAEAQEPPRFHRFSIRHPFTTRSNRNLVGDDVGDSTSSSTTINSSTPTTMTPTTSQIYV